MEKTFSRTSFDNPESELAKEEYKKYLKAVKDALDGTTAFAVFYKDATGIKCNICALNEDLPKFGIEMMKTSKDLALNMLDDLLKEAQERLKQARKEI